MSEKVTESPIRSYFANIGRAIFSTFEGLTVTSSWLFRRPMTVQYPDKIEKPVQEMLPVNYRGILEVDLNRCGGCQLCMKACPIKVLDVRVEKNANTGVREITRFDIDIGRCMYCGLCSEACNFDAIRHTPDFEAVMSSPEHLILHYVKSPRPVAKPKGNDPAPRPKGTILAQTAPDCFERVRWPGFKEEAPAVVAEPVSVPAAPAPAPALDPATAQAPAPAPTEKETK